MTLPHSTADAASRDNADSERGLRDYASVEPSDSDPDHAAGAVGSLRHRQPLRTLPKRWGIRWPIRAKLLTGLLIPVLSIALLAGAAVADLSTNISSAAYAHRLADLDVRATALIQALQAERANAATILAGNLTATDARFAERTATADTAIRQFFQALKDLHVDSGSPIAAAVMGAQRSMRSLASLRDAVRRPGLDSAAAMQRYGSIVGSVAAIVDAAPDGVRQAPLANRLRGVALFAHYSEAGAQEAYLLYTAAVSSGFERASYRDFLASLREQEAYLAQFEQLAAAGDRRLVEQRLSRAQLGGVLTAESAAIRTGESGDIGVSAEKWQSTAQARTELVNAVARQLNSTAVDASSSEQTKQLLYAAGIALFALVMSVLSVIVAMRIARSMGRGLYKLRDSALEVAHRSLPEIVEQLRDIDAAHSSGSKVAKVRATAAEVTAERLRHKSIDEIGDVAHAFHLVHVEAIGIAVQQAQVRLSVATTFVNLARRSQLLVDRLIGLIDHLEHSERDPDRLSELFQLDHLVTRMRRNDENLLVLAGAEAGRRWTSTAALLDVLRAATAEIEQYTRVKIGDVIPVAVAAHAVSDVVHLVAELAENATTFSPPSTDVSVQTHISRGSVVIEIRDHGIGMAADQLTELNERLAAPHAANVQPSRMMGLHVVSKLATRHDVAVSLAAALPQGTTATVTLPATLFQVSEDAPDFDTAGEAQGGEIEFPQETEIGTDIGAIPLQPNAAEHDWRPPPAETPSDNEQLTEFTKPTPSRDEQLTELVKPTPAGDEQRTEFAKPTPKLEKLRGRKHWRYSELTEKDSVNVVNLAIFESMESEWFREVPTQRWPAPTTKSAGVKKSDANDSKTDTEQGKLPAATQIPNRDSEQAQDPAAPPAASVNPTAVSPSTSIRVQVPMPAAQTQPSDTAAVRPQWQSAADGDWQRATATPNTGGMTEAGLPKRVPKANFIPGCIGTAAQIAAAAIPLRRSPEAIAAGLSSYRSGVLRGRQADRVNKPAQPHDTNESKE